MLSFSLFAPFAGQLKHGVTLKAEGSFNSAEPDFENNREALRAKNGLPPVAWADQVHGAAVVRLEGEAIQNTLREPPRADAFITQSTAVCPLIKVADCQALLLFDPVTRSIAAVHAGWRGVAQRIFTETVRTLEAACGVRAADLRVGVSPSIGPCCAEFSDPRAELPAFLHPFIRGRQVDLWAATQSEAAALGIPEDQVEILRTCTRCNETCFSHRRGETGRMAAFIALC